jgi:hypothetical protein
VSAVAIGMRVGTWTVVCASRAKADEPLWRCVCDCGRRRTVRESRWLEGRIRPCVCIDLAGLRFGRWTVLRRGVRWAGKRLWHCECDCGSRGLVEAFSLRKGGTLSCGCGKRKVGLEGRRFGRWTVVARASRSRWQCRCDCGTTRPVRRVALEGGSSLSCGCRTGRGRLGGAFRNLAGKRFGRWTVLDRVAEAGISRWRCVCDCGWSSCVRATRLRNGSSRSCGCVAAQGPRALDMTGQRFGRLTVQARQGKSAHGEATWRVRCDCGQAFEVVGRSLRTGNTRSCGCLRAELARGRRAFQEAAE